MRGRNNHILTICLLLSFGFFGGAEERFIIYQSAGEILAPPVTFLHTVPEIDGHLDPGLVSLPQRAFNYCIKYSESVSEHPISYRMGYNGSFLYIHVTVEARRLIVRDRAYQNGDGILLVLNKPKKGGGTPDEFCVLGFAPRGKNLPRWSFMWNKNGDWPFSPLGPKTQFVARQDENLLKFEILLPWSEVHPFHPWLTDTVGFNLIFTKAEGETGSCGYMLAVDEAAKNLQFSDHLIMGFEKPKLTAGTQTHVVLTRSHIRQGEKIQLRTVSLAGSPTMGMLRIAVFSGEGNWLDINRFNLKSGPGPATDTFELETSGLLPGGYRVGWNALPEGTSDYINLTIFPPFETDVLQKRISNLTNKVSAGTVTTLQFMVADLAAQSGRLKPSDTSGRLRTRMQKFFNLLRAAEAGRDEIAARRGYVRRAYQSVVDQTLQPYTVKVPADYNPEKRYPAIVFLHGSDRDDQAVKQHGYVGKEGFFIIAPNGRGPQTCYTVAHAQEDIQEAIRDALKNYSIDGKKLILAGFSMGGYGAYRTYYETPEKYLGVAVFSGDPNLGNQYISGDKHPNFLRDEYLSHFKGARIAIFHGRKDRNCPFELTEQVVDKLRKLGVAVEYHIDDTVGHSPPRQKKIQAAYQNWLSRCIELSEK